MTKAHAEKETLSVEVNIPAHADRTTTALFRHTREQLIQRELGKCWICQRTATEAGHPLEAHHHPIERSLMNMVDWELFATQARRGDYGPYPAVFDWDNFDPATPETFVDDMRHNGLLACKSHHVGRDEGIHQLPWPLFLAQRFGKEGYRFSDVEIIHHDQE